jgi:hypothetical protein
LECRHPYGDGIDAVCFQTWFDLTPEKMAGLTERINVAWPNAELAYLDSFAPADLRYAEVLDPYVRAYVKKQTLKDFCRYDDITTGDTNLTDFYAKRFRIDLPKTKFSIPSGFRQKLLLASGFEYSPEILPNLSRSPAYGHRDIDVHARIATEGTEWYTQMRREAHAMAASLDGRFRVAHRGRVSRRQYLNELRNSKLCFSPFGYGEVCWRDFEAMSMGALLLKPDMSHLQLGNDFFKPYETYVPLSWDLSDLHEKVEYYVHHALETEGIAHNAFDLLSQQCHMRKFLQDISPLWKLLNVS